MELPKKSVTPSTWGSWANLSCIALDSITGNCKIITQLVVLLNNDILSGKKEKMENNGRRI